MYEAARAESIAAGDEVIELELAELQAIAAAVGIGAVKYADLSLNRMTNYVFSYQKMLSLQGNTAPYMMYAYVRVRGIFRRAEGVERVSAGDVLVTAPEERALANMPDAHCVAFDEEIVEHVQAGRAEEAGLVARKHMDEARDIRLALAVRTGR